MNVILRRILALWVRAELRPADAAAAINDCDAPVCYLLERRSAADLAVLQNLAARNGLPRPGKRLLRPGEHAEVRSVITLLRPRGFFGRRYDRRPPPELLILIDALRSHEGSDVALVPVAVYWGRAPHKEGSLWRLLFAENWALTGRLRKLLTVVFNGRATLVEVGKAISLRSLINGERSTAALARGATRSLRNQFRAQRAARIGPDLSHRRNIRGEILRTAAVRNAVRQEMRERKVDRRSALRTAQQYVDEIAANYSHNFVRIMERVLRRLWNRLYDGVDFAHASTLTSVATGSEIVYVPCHRSHMDYLLLSYAIYREGFAIPHIAAGINLNLPVIGRFLRKGGGFFLRRSFAGNTLYTVVFMKYLAAIMARGHSIEYFIEGGRSRTGRLLQPKTGLLAMTLRSFLRERKRPVVFLPVYFGYERIVEVGTYVGELSGKQKQKETTLGFLRSLRILREHFGRVHVNVGEPIALETVLDQHEPKWRDHDYDDGNRPAWVGPATDALGQQIMRNINAAAAMTPVNLLALVMLATPRQVMLETDLANQIDGYLGLMRQCPYSERVTVTSLVGREVIDYCYRLGMIERQQQKFGVLVSMTDANATLAAYYRNNCQHLLALPSLLACAFAGNPVMRTEDLQRLAWRIYPYVQAELFLRWDENELPEVVDRTLASMAMLGLIEAQSDGTGWRRPPPTTGAAMQLSLLAQGMLQTIERYYLAIAQLLRAGRGQLTARELVELCHLTAQRISMTYGLNSPEFFDRSLFVNFIDLLKARAVVTLDDQGKLQFDEVLIRVAADAQVVLSDEIRHSILQVTHS
ncbi:MAG: glycerol-3-phosphate 1-O-acyltransferase PlsB [Steroidobacteraceae bacterium]